MEGEKMEKETCKWKQTGCELTFNCAPFSAIPIMESPQFWGFEFCPFCGKLIEEEK